jgi:HPt (histidine-containing phosphotransfer) domain-containing protein
MTDRILRCVTAHLNKPLQKLFQTEMGEEVPQKFPSSSHQVLRNFRRTMAVTFMLSRLLKQFLKPFQSASPEAAKERNDHAKRLDEQESLRIAIRGLGAEMEVSIARHGFAQPSPLSPEDELACMRQEISKIVDVRQCEIARDVIDEEMIHRICQYDDGSHGDTLTELISLYLQLAPKRIENLKRALSEKNWHAVSKETHSLKSSSANLGLKKVIAACRRLEAIENHPDYSMACALLSEIEKEYQAAALSLMELLKQRVPARKAAA